MTIDKPPVCGTADKKIYDSMAVGYGEDTLCAVGTPSIALFPTVGGRTDWTCTNTFAGGISYSV